MAALTRAMGALSISAASVCVAPSSGRCALRSSSASVSFSSSSFAGVSLRPSMSQRLVLPIRRNLVVRAKRPSLGCTKRSRSRKSRARVSGFRARIQTPTGRNVLRRRRAKGRHDLVPASNPNSGKLA